MTNEDIDLLEQYVVRLYDRTSTCESVNDARKVLFSRRSRPHRDLLFSMLTGLHIRQVMYDDKLSSSTVFTMSFTMGLEFKGRQLGPCVDTFTTGTNCVQRTYKLWSQKGV